MARDSFVSWYKMFVRLESVFESAPDECAGRALKASFVYARTGEVPELDPVSMILFSAIKPSIDDSAESFENISKRNKQNIEKRWKGKSQKGATDTKVYQSIPNVPDIPDDTEDRSKKIEVRSKKIEDRSIDNENRTLTASNARESAQKRPRFVPPGNDEVIAFFGDQGSSTQQANSFFDFYTANGWKVGRNAMKDWKAAARGWIRRAYDYNNSRQPRRDTTAETLETLAQVTEELNGGMFPQILGGVNE